MERKIPELFIHSRQEVELIRPRKPFIVISFIDPGDSKPKITSINRKNLLTIEVSDVDDPVFAEKHNKKLLSDKQAQDIVRFVFENLDSVEEIHCHCNAGICRSAAAIAAFSKIFTGDDSKVFNNPLKIPNMHIYRKILNVAYDLGFWHPQLTK